MSSKESKYEWVYSSFIHILIAVLAFVCGAIVSANVLAENPEYRMEDIRIMLYDLDMRVSSLENKND